MLLAIVVLLRYQATQQEHWQADDPVRIEEARQLLPGAVRMTPSKHVRDGLDILDKDGELLGFVVRTMPAAEDVVGYRGPTDALLALDPQGKIVGMRLRRSADTPDHLRDVAGDREFMASFNGWRLQDISTFDNARVLENEEIWPVSGATLTSTAVIDGVIARARADEQAAAQPQAFRFGRSDALILVWVAVGLVFSFTRARQKRKTRELYRFIVLAWHLGAGGGLIALTLYSGWAMHGSPWRTAPGLVALVLLMFGIPLLFGRNVYCQELCPHGIAQDWLRRVPKLKRATIPKPVRRGLRWLAPGLLGASLIVVLLNLPRDLSAIEPFDTYPLWRSGTWAWGGTILVFVIGLLVSARYPMAYCNHACPTGWLLRWLSATHRRRWTLGDTALVVLLSLTGTVVLLGPRAWSFVYPGGNVPSLGTPEFDPDAPSTETSLAPSVDDSSMLHLDGISMRTRWRAYVIAPTSGADAMGRIIVDTLTQLETQASVWRTGSDLQRANATPSGKWATVSPQTAHLLHLARQLHRDSGGAFDPTLGRPMARSGWGAPSLRSLPLLPLDRRRWEMDLAAHQVRRLDAGCAFDLGGLLQGAAADAVAQRLLESGVAGCLVEVGGEVRVAGKTPPEGWPVHVERLDGTRQVVRIASGAIATSGTHKMRDQNTSHLIDPLTGRPQMSVCQVTVYTPQAAVADAWATALAAIGPRQAIELARENHIHATIQWIDEAGYQEATLISEKDFAKIE